VNQTIRSIVWCLLASSFIFLPRSFVRADGGTIRVSEQSGPYRITVFTSPTALRAGPVDISVLVQNGLTGEVESGVQVDIEAVHQSLSEVTLHQRASTENATNKLYYTALVDLPESGWYLVQVSVHGDRGAAQVAFRLEAANPLPSWLALTPWVAWPGAAVLLFGMHRVLVTRKLARGANNTADVSGGLMKSSGSFRAFGKPVIREVTHGQHPAAPGARIRPATPGAIPDDSPQPCKGER
jgi:hypothetical protein